MVSFHSICESRHLGRFRVGTHELTHHCRLRSTCTTLGSLFSSQLAMLGTWDDRFLCRRSISCPTCLMFLPSMYPLFFLSLCLCACFLPLPWRLLFSLPLRLLLSAFLFPQTVECIMLLQSRRAQSDVSSPLLILWVVCEHRCFDCVPERVQILRLVLPYRTLPLLQGLTSVFRERTLQQLHQHRSISTSVHRLPLFQKSSPDLESTGSLNLVIGLPDLPCASST